MDLEMYLEMELTPCIISSGWMEVELEMELTPIQLRLDRCGAGYGVHPLT